MVFQRSQRWYDDLPGVVSNSSVQEYCCWYVETKSSLGSANFSSDGSFVVWQKYWIWCLKSEPEPYPSVTSTRAYARGQHLAIEERRAQSDCQATGRLLAFARPARHEGQELSVASVLSQLIMATKCLQQSWRFTHPISTTVSVAVRRRTTSRMRREGHCRRGCR